MDNLADIIQKQSKIRDLRAAISRAEAARACAARVLSAEMDLQRLNDSLPDSIDRRDSASASVSAAQSRIFELSKQLAQAHLIYESAMADHTSQCNQVANITGQIQRCRAMLDHDTTRTALETIENEIAARWADIGVDPCDIDELEKQCTRDFNQSVLTYSSMTASSAAIASTSLHHSTTTAGGTTVTLQPKYDKESVDRTERVLREHATRLGCLSAVQNINCTDHRRDKYMRWLREETFITPGQLSLRFEDGKLPQHTVLSYFRGKDINLEIAEESVQKSSAPRWWVFRDRVDGADVSRAIGKIIFAFEDTTRTAQISVFYLYLSDLLKV